nr:PP2C family protein-serine/threonine phosphatase [Planosporangium thailandense]
MLPPLSFATDHVVISAILEPAYEVGGDAFDYAVDADVARVAVLDAVGRGLHAGLTAAVALSAMRTARIDGDGLYAVARAADEALTDNFGDQRYVTAVLAEIDLISGAVRYVNAGHPPPVLLRGGKAVGVLDRGRRMPLGLDDPAVEPAELALEPGDRLLFHTDGFTEARDEHGGEFGVHRLVDFAERHAAAGLPVPETLRRLSHDVLAHQYGPLRDDATLLMVSWSEEDSRRVLV